MKRINILVVFTLLIFSCKGQDKQKEEGLNPVEKVNYASFGASFNVKDAFKSEVITKKYENLSAKDTIETKFSAVVSEVCQAKGCWMKLKLDGGSEAMVKFKDYSFFMPKGIAGEQVVVNGKAFIEEMSVQEQRHYAKDGGESDEAIALIVTPKKTFRFEADGVLLKQ